MKKHGKDSIIVLSAGPIWFPDQADLEKSIMAELPNSIRGVKVAEQAPAKVIQNHPKFMMRWAKNYVDWYQRLGKSNADVKLMSMFDGKTIKELSTYIVTEFKSRGYKM